MNMESVEALILKAVPGDVVIIRVDLAANTPIVVRGFMEEIQGALPPDVRLIVLDKAVAVEHLDDHAKAELIQGLQDTCQMKRYLVVGGPADAGAAFAYNVEAGSEEEARELVKKFFAFRYGHDGNSDLSQTWWTAGAVRWITPADVERYCAVVPKVKKAP